MGVDLASAEIRESGRVKAALSISGRETVVVTQKTMGIFFVGSPQIHQAVDYLYALGHMRNRLISGLPNIYACRRRKALEAF